tara:strand:- start:2 stop:463 length:462 start_codon:yes stop_codon:yes gene_type:complete
MRFQFAVYISILIFTGLTMATQAGEEDEVIAVMDAHLGAINNGESAAIARHHLPGHSEFGATGAKLGISGPFEEQFARNEAIFKSGAAFDWHNKDLRVQIFDTTAIVTGYVVGTSTNPEGTTTTVNQRRTTVLIKTNGQWKEIHVHNSVLLEE